MHLRVNSPYAVLLSMPSLAVSRTDTGRDQSILRTMSMQPGARNGRNVLNSASYDSTRIGKHRVRRLCSWSFSCNWTTAIAWSYASH